MTINKINRLKGFSMIELVVVIAITGIILPSLFSIIFTLLRLQIQLTQLQRLKEVGDYVSDVMINTIKTNAKTVDASCLTESPFNTIGETDSNIMFRDRFDNCFGYFVKDEKLSSISAVLKAEDDYKTDLISGEDSDFQVTVIEPEMTKETDKLAKIKFTVQYQPKVNYLTTQKLHYQFYTYIRN